MLTKCQHKAIITLEEHSVMHKTKLSKRVLAKSHDTEHNLLAHKLGRGSKPRLRVSRRKSMTTELLSPTDVIAAVLALFYRDHDLKKMTTDRRVLHSVLYQMRQKGDDLLSGFRFDTSDIYPYSSTFDEALANMQITGHLKRSNPDMDKFDIDGSVESYFDSTLNGKFPAERLEQLKKISAQLAKDLR